MPVLASSWHAAERVCDPPLPHTHAENVHPWASDVLHQGQAVHAEGVADIGNSRLGDVAIGFSSVTTVPLFTIAIAITNGSCPEHPRFKAMAKPRTEG
jgi:hypothetical protein